MKKEQKQAIIESGKQYFRSIIIPNHLKNLDIAVILILNFITLIKSKER